MSSDAAEADDPDRTVTREEFVAAVAERKRNDKELQKRSRTVDRRMLVLFAALTVAFVWQSWRTEMNTNDIRTGFHDACLARVHTTTQSRDALMQMAALPRTPPQTEAQKEQSRKAVELLLPIEDCGPG